MSADGSFHHQYHLLTRLTPAPPVLVMLLYYFYYKCITTMKLSSNQPTMITGKQVHIDAETIESVGLQLTDTPLTAEAAPLSARVYTYPHLDNVYIMETDLYGNAMPKDSCFVAFKGQHGLIGRSLKIEKLRRSTVTDIEKIVHDNETS
jgi:hypothetical protein